MSQAFDPIKRRRLSDPAPAGGLQVDFAGDPAVATPTASVIFAPGQSDATIAVTGAMNDVLRNVAIAAARNSVAASA